MNKTIKFTLTTIWILFSRCFDAYCTFNLTPDLSKESNPLVTVVGISSWPILLMVIGFLTIYIIYAYYVSIFKPMNLLPTEKGHSFSNVIAYLYLGQKDHWTAVLYRFPTNIKRLNTYLGHIMSLSLGFAGVISTLMWVLIRNSEYYRTIHSAPLIYSILILGCITIAFFWNKSMYSKYLAQ